MIAYRHPILEQYRAADDSCIVTDDYLKSLEEKFGEASALQKKQDSMQSTSRAAMATCWQSFPLLIIAPANMVDA